MRWDSLTGLEAETDEERREIRREMWRFANSLGRISLFMLVSITFVMTVPSWPVEIGQSLDFSLSVAIVGAGIWSLAPSLRAVYGLIKMQREAHTGPRNHEWEAEQ